MKRTMKRIQTWLLILLAALLLTACAAGKKGDVAAVDTADAVMADTTDVAADTPAETAEPAQLPNPVHDVADYNALLAAMPGVLMADAPKGAEQVTYLWIEGEPAIAQISFMLDDNSYTYRGAKADGVNSMADISGVYDTLDKSVEMIAPDKDGLIGGNFTLEYAKDSTVGKATWFYIPTGCQYSVTTPDGCDVSQGILSVVEQVMPISGITKDDLAASGLVEGGTVVTAQDGELTVNTQDGRTLTFNMDMLPDLSFAAGDVVDVSYSEIDGNLIALDVAKNTTAVAAAANTISGAVYSCTRDSVYVSTADGMVYGFVLDGNTAYSGESKTLRVGSEVTLTYEGDLAANVRAKNIETTKVGGGKAASSSSSSSSAIDGDPASTENKRLTGYVTDYSGSSITIQTGNGHYWTFRISSLTSYYGNYSLGVGSKVRISYDGYASDMPLAKHIQIYSDKNSNPAPRPTTAPTPTKRTMEGFLLSISSTSLSIDTASGNPHSFIITPATEIVGYCDYYGSVRVTFYGDEASDYKTATRIVLG